MQASQKVPAGSSRIVIEPPRGPSLRLRELWQYRELAVILVQRAVKPLYRQTVLGFGWAIIPPFMLMVVFSVFFHNVAKVPSEAGVPYPIFSFSGLLIWQYFTVATAAGSGGLTANSNFLQKIYFPRLLIPIASVSAALFNLAASSIVLAGLMAYYRYVPTWRLVVLPGFVLLAFAIALGIALWASAASVRFRDLSLAVPLMLQVLLFATPVIYPVKIFHGGWQTVLSYANPMSPVVEGFRWTILGKGAPSIGPVLVAAAFALVLVISGALFFDRLERTFADTV
jgi:lipopolysaccharide transport system permease protein